jgi:hypothetical protein
MGRPLNKRYFGVNVADNLKVQFFNGDASVPGFIVKQTGSKRFICQDKDGNRATCYLVEKASAELSQGEMSITVAYDNSTVGQITKIATHKVTINGESMPWSFGNNTGDARVQIEEAGQDGSLTDGDDLEGDDIHINGDYPVPGSGTYRTAAIALAGITFANKGTPYNPLSNVASVTNATPGLLRNKYDGNFCAANNTVPASWNYSFFDTADFIKSIADEDVSWGQQNDGDGLGEHNFSIEWKGYVRAPGSTAQNYNFYAESDDHIAMWIGTAALNAPTNATRLLGSANKVLPANATTAGVANANSVTLAGQQWYPIRIWFSEFTGGCKAQIYLQAADGTKYNGADLEFTHNPTEGSGF